LTMNSIEQRVTKLEAELRQARLEVELARDREMKLIDNRKNIFNVFYELFTANGQEQQFATLIAALHNIITFEEVVLISHSMESDDSSNMEVVYASHPALKNHPWKMDGVLNIALKTQDIIILSNPGVAAGFESNDPEFLSHVRSVMVIPIIFEYQQLLFVCTHHVPLRLDMRSRVDVKNYLPFIEQSIACISYRSLLETIVTEHTNEMVDYHSKLQSFRNLSHEIFWQTDTSYRLVQVSVEAGNIHFLDSNDKRNLPIYESFIGKTIYDLIDGSLVNKHSQPMVDLAKIVKDHGFIANVELPFNLNGRKLWVVLSGEPYYGHQGDFQGYRGIIKDISREHQERQDFENAKLEAEQADRSKTEYLAVMSHEIKTPLQAILGMIDLLEQTELNEVQTSYIKHVHQSASLLQTILHDVLDLSRITSKAMTLENVSFDIKFALNSTIIQMRDKALEKKISLKLNIADNFPTLIYGDQHRLSQILFNLINNAIKFTSEGGVTVNAERFENRLKFSITDTGPGIEPENLGNLFQPFVQVDSSISRKYGGTGLGLSICKRLVEHMGGKIGIRSEKGKGSTFWFEIPCKVPSSPLIGANSVRRDKTEHREHNYRILLVEDSQINQFVIKTMLEKLGHKVTLANNGLESIEAIKKELPDLVLMDIRMPVMDGIEATRQILGTIAPLPIVALTANNSDEERIECRKVGMVSIASKPVTTQTLKVLLDDLEGVIEEYGQKIKEGNYKLMANLPDSKTDGSDEDNGNTKVGTVSSENTKSNASLIDALIKNKLGADRNNRTSRNQRT